MSFPQLVRPESIAVIGASASPQKVGYSILANIVEGGYEGRVFPVNPKAESILDIPCFASVLDIPDKVDCAVVVVKRELVVPVLRECGRKQVGAAIVITAGFGETGDEGKGLEREIIRIAGQYKITLIGPNCLGLVNPLIKLNAAFGQGLGKAGDIALLSQSGALITAIQDWAHEKKIGFSLIASIGNKACIDEVDFFDFLKKESSTRVIAAYLEDVSRGQDFMHSAEVVGKEKPVVILKAGRTTSGARAASSHTGSLAGADAAYSSAFQRTGVIRAESIEHLFDVAVALAYQPLPAGRNIAVITNAGGPGIMMTDALEMAGLAMAKLDDQTRSRLNEVLPAAASSHNPVDVLGDADGERYHEAMTIVLSSASVDGMIVILTPQKMTDAEGTANALVSVSKQFSKPVLACFMGAGTIARAADILADNTIPHYPIPERAARALATMANYAEYRARPLRAVERFSVNRNRVAKIVKAARNRGVVEIGEFDAKAILSAYNFEMPPGTLATTVDEATRFAEQIGYPLAMKISSPDILHKSDMGGVRLGLESRSAVEDAFELMVLRIQRAQPDAEIRGVMIEKMVTGGREVILGMKKDPQFGPMLMFGLGGIFVEVLKDVTFSLAPVTRDECISMIRRTKTYKLLEGVRGEAGVDIGAIVTNIVRLSQLVMDFPEIQEVDINPLKAGQAGDGTFVVDARIIIGNV